MWRRSSSSSGIMEAIAAATSPSLSLLHSRSLSSAVSRLAPHPTNLAEWVRSEGGFVHQAVTISDSTPYGPGLVASDPIPEGSDLISLPSHLPLKFDDGSCSVLGSVAQRVPEELWAMRLGLRLLQERAKSGSFWSPYITNLPDTYSTPIFFQEEDIKNLQYAPLLHQVNKRFQFLLDFEKEVKGFVANLKPGDHPFGGQEIDASSLRWAMSAVSSRAFRLPRDKLSDRVLTDMPIMLPLIDMCNHSFYPNAKIIQDQDAESSKMIVKVIAEHDIKENDPLELNYGCLSNDLFLLDYGFIIKSNPYDCIELRYDGALLDAASTAAGLSSPYFLSPASWQQEILARLKLDGEAADLKVTLGGPELIEGRLLAALRVLHANNPDTVLKHDLSTLQSSSSEAPLGIANEVAALRTIIRLCAIVLEDFPAKITDDEELLKEGGSSPSELAIRFRIQKKSLIINVILGVTKRLQELMQSKQSAPAAA